MPDDPLPTDIVLDPGDPDFGQTGLHGRSTLRTHRLLTVASSLIKRELGTLSPRLQTSVTDALRRLFAIEASVGASAPPPREGDEGTGPKTPG
jgi:hypothetical protein